MDKEICNLPSCDSFQSVAFILDAEVETTGSKFKIFYYYLVDLLFFFSHKVRIVVCDARNTPRRTVSVLRRTSGVTNIAC